MNSTTAASWCASAPRWPSAPAASSNSIGRRRLPPAPMMYSATWLISTTSEASRRRISASTAVMSAAASDWMAGRPSGSLRRGVMGQVRQLSLIHISTQAALDVYADRPVAVLVGGHDRGLPWDEFADAMRVHAPIAIITMGQNGPRIHPLLAPIAAQAGFTLQAANDLADAMAKARAALPKGGVILLSPGAPSFGAYKNYVARGRHFAELAGFDPAMISNIAGMGIG